MISGYLKKLEEYGTTKLLWRDAPTSFDNGGREHHDLAAFADGWLIYLVSTFWRVLCA